MLHSSTPNLFRAVAECTQPYGPPASGSSVRSLQSYLTNDRCVDSVYRAILARACAEPQSEAVISKCIALIKQYVSRHLPSPPVLEAIAVACQRLAASLPLDSVLQKSLVYLENSVARLAGSTLAGRRIAQLQSRPGSSGSPRPWLHAAVNGDRHHSRQGGSAHSMHSSTSEDLAAGAAAAAGGTGAQQAKPGGQTAGSPVRGTFEEPGVGLSQLQQQQQPQQQLECWSENAGDEDVEELMLMDAVRVVEPEPCLPDWTFQPSALSELWGQGPLDCEDGEELGELDWSLLLPHYSPSLVPLVEGLSGMEVLHMLSSQDIIDAVTDADQQTLLRQMKEIAEVRRMQSGVTPELLQQALQQSRSRRARRLFQPLPYIHQEHIDVSSTDVAAVVEIMCGKPSPATPSSITGTVGMDDPSVYWQQPAAQPPQGPLLLYQQSSGQQQQQQHSESVGQISSCILVKLIVDLWLSAGGTTAFPLVLRMLQQALYQSQPEYRVCAFDIIYNLSLHGCMLMPPQSSHPASPTSQLDRRYRAAQGGAGSLLRHQQQQYQQELQQLGMQMQRMHPHNLSLQHAAAGYDPLPAATGGAAGVTAAAAGGGGGGGSDTQGSPKSQGSNGGLSPLPSPRIHLPPQLLVQQPPSPQQQAAAAAAGQQFGSVSPLPSPKARSRLSRSELRINAEQLMQQQGTTGDQQQQQQQQLGSSAVGAAGDDDEQEAAAGQAGVSIERDAADAEGSEGGEGVDDGASITEGLLPVEVAWEAWLQQLLYELLLMLSMVEEPCEEVWQSAVGCLLQLTTHAGHWVAANLSTLPPAAAAALLDACVAFNWSQELHAHLVQMAVNLLYVTEAMLGGVGSGRAAGPGGAAAAGACAGRGVVQQGAGSSPVRNWVRSPGRWQQQQQQQQLRAGVPHMHKGQEEKEEGDCDDTCSTTSSSRSSRGTAPLAAGRASARGEDEDDHHHQQQQQQQQQQQPELDLPCQLHAGPVDEQQLEAFGGPAKLLKHFCHAASVEAQRTLLVPLLQVLMPPDAPDASQLAVLQVLCSSPNCLAALQATLSAGIPGWADSILTAITQMLDDQDLDLQLLAAVLLRLEDLAVGEVHAAAAELLGSKKQQQQQQGLGDTAAAAGQEEDPSISSNDDFGSSSAAGAAATAPAATLGVSMSMPGEVAAAMQITLQQLAGNLPAQPQVRPGPQGSGGTVVYQVAPEVQGSWKALKALCWCDNELARQVARQWLQRLLALTLQQSLKGTILLPLPGVTQRTPTAQAAASSSSTGGGAAAAAAASSPAAATTAAIVAACNSWVEVLVQLVSHCPKGPDTLVDALQLHITCCKLQLSSDDCDASSSPLSAAAAAAAAAMPAAAAAAAGGPGGSQQQQRAAVARVCVQAWAFVCQWVMQAKTSSSQAALTRLAGMAQTLACVPQVPEWLDALGAQGVAAGAAGAGAAAGGVSSGSMAAAAAAGQTTASRSQTLTSRGIRDREAGSAIEAGSSSEHAAAAAAAAADAGREDEAGYRGMGVPPPEPSSEPSALAALLAAEGRAAAGAGRQGPGGWGCSPEAAAAAVAAAEAVCWPQAFLLGRALLPQQMAQVLSGASLALLLVRLLQCKQPSRAADRGFHGRPSSSTYAGAGAAAAAAAGAVAAGVKGSWGMGSGGAEAGGGVVDGVLPCPVLYPWSDGRQDLQLGLMLMLMSSCSSEAENFAEFGLEAVTQQVLSRCTDPRACLLVSQFMLEHLMRHQQERYWSALRQLVAAAQQADDERLLGNPFLQLVTLLSQQQQQSGGGGVGG